MSKIDINCLKPVSFENIEICDKFWKSRIDTVNKITLKACIKKCEETGRISNFIKAAGKMEGRHEGMIFNDSDVYKILEGIAYSLVNNRDKEMEMKADEIISIIADAQEQDGYINTYFTLEKPEKKWTDMMAHECYCGGHLIEAAVAYYKATGKHKLLDIAIRFANHLISVFGEGKKHWVSGHQEIELALIKLFKITGKKEYLSLSQWFIDERGHGYYYYEDGFSWNVGAFGGVSYFQDDKPVREMTDIKGHAVRAMYMYVAMADIAAITGDAGYMAALGRLWDSAVYRNMYITGGIGSSKDNEGFTGDYNLPNDTAYCETCASVGMTYWNHRMNMMYGDSKYADIMELEMYNGVLSGLSYSGERFFYVNPLETDGIHHRQEWFDVSCCPGQLMRFIPAVGEYIYATSKGGIYVNLFVESKATIEMEGKKITIAQSTEYPWDGRVSFTIQATEKENFEINLRYPGWCKSVSVMVNGVMLEELYIEKGYIKILRAWNQGDKIELNMEMPVERVISHPKIDANSGKIAIKRGPLVYCMEETDNKDCFDMIKIKKESKFLVTNSPKVLEGGNMIREISTSEEQGAAFIPYFAWDNREPGRMKVWIPLD